jgi:hypothetical protein
MDESKDKRNRRLEAARAAIPARSAKKEAK